MKLSDIRPNIQSSGDLEEQFFSIQDQGMIFDILRNKMYSNPILAICREISCNARDAHREIGKSKQPIQITLPTALEPFFKVKDFGPGISPDRMANVFIKYTASTKRNDNIQTGGFGLGAKTPFSYSDTFTIITNVDGIQYNYACFIDETKVGKLAMLHKQVTLEPNGTEIVIPVKSADYNAFHQWTESATRHWDVRPIFKGYLCHYKPITKVVEGFNWAVINTNNYNREVKAIIDGIEYPLDLTALRTYTNSKLIDSMRGSFLLYFDIGDLTLSASREQVYIDKQTQQKIKDRFDTIVNDIRAEIQKKIDLCQDLWNANIYYSNEVVNAFTNLSVLGKFKWNGIDVISNSESRSPGCPLYTFTKGKYIRGKGHDPDKIVRERYNNLSFHSNHLLFINDLDIKEPTTRHVKKAFDDNPNIKGIQVICPSTIVTETVLNKDIGLDKLTKNRLSSITKASKKYANSARLLIFKFTGYSFSQVSYASMEEDVNDKIICMLDNHKDDGKFIVTKNKMLINNRILNALINKHANYSIYGVGISTPADRVEEEFSDFISIENFIDDKIINNKSIDYPAIKQSILNQSAIDYKCLNHEDLILKTIKDPNSLFLKRLLRHKKSKNSSSDYDNELLGFYEILAGVIDATKMKTYLDNNPDMNLKSINKICSKKYPLISHISSYEYESAITSILEYVNMVDETLKNKEVENV